MTWQLYIIIATIVCVITVASIVTAISRNKPRDELPQLEITGTSARSYRERAENSARLSKLRRS